MDATSCIAKVSYRHYIIHVLLFTNLLQLLLFDFSGPFINYRHNVLAARQMVKESSASSGSWSCGDDAESTDSNTPLYSTIYGAYYEHIKFNKSHKYHNKWKKFVKYCMGLWKDQNMVCNITGGPMDLERGPTMPSLDAIIGDNGHVEGNLHFVCHFVNHSQFRDCENPTHITAEWYQKYIRR